MEIALASAAEGLQLGGQEHRCGDDANRATAWQPLKLGGVQGEGVSAVGETQDLALGWHQIEHEVFLEASCRGWLPSWW